MALTYGDTKKRALKLLDEYDTTGVIQSTTDVNIKIQDFTNDAMKNLAETTARIPGVKHIINAPVRNTLAYDTSAIKTFEPGGADISITLTNARSCYFEIIGPATVHIEEATAGSTTYTPLETIAVPGSVTEFTEYRRLINPTQLTNMIRLRFTGSYVFHVRNYILYPYAWESEADVQQHRPFFEYDLPSDCLELNNVMAKKDVRQFIPYAKYVLLPNKRIGFNRYDAPAEFVVNYWRMPTLFVYTDVEETNDAQIYGIDRINGTYRVSDDAAMVIPYYVAGNILLSEGGANGVTVGMTLLNIYEARKSEIISNKTEEQGTILNVTGW